MPWFRVKATIVDKHGKRMVSPLINAKTPDEAKAKIKLLYQGQVVPHWAVAEPEKTPGTRPAAPVVGDGGM